MKNPKVVWAEGICLSQQHFQQWEKWLLRDIYSRQRWLSPNSYGVVELDLDERALEYHQVNISRCSAIFQNGANLYFSNEHMPLSLSLKERADEPIDIYIGIAKNDYVPSIPGYQDKPFIPAWSVETISKADIYDETRERDLLLGELNSYLLTQFDALDNYYSLRILRLQPGPKGFVVDNSYIPSCLQIKASNYLKKEINYLYHKVQSVIKGIDLDCMTSCTPKDWLYFQKLSQLMSHLSLYLNHDELHPFGLYKDLMTVINDYEIKYNHADLVETFHALFASINDTVEHVNMSNRICLELQEISQSIYMIDKLDIASMSRHQLLIKLQGAEDILHSIQEQKNCFKLASANSISSVISSALTGLLVSQKKEGYLGSKELYYKLEMSGPYWESIVAEKTLAVYMPEIFSDVSISLVIERES